MSDNLPVMYSVLLWTLNLNKFCQIYIGLKVTDGYEFTETCAELELWHMMTMNIIKYINLKF